MIQLSTFEVLSKYIYTHFLGVGAPLITNAQIGTQMVGGVQGQEVETVYVNTSELWP